MKIKVLFALSFLVFSGVVVAQTAIDSSGTILIGGIKQYVSVKSKDNTKPLLLFLHGGPGNSVIHYAEKFTNKLQEHFIVVQWDQRESGKTLTLNKSPEPLQVSLFQIDTKALIDSLLKRFNQPKLYLVGHSWGTVPGFYIAKNHPHLLHAYIPICPMVNQLDSERIILELMKEQAKKTKNSDALAELVSIAIPFENGEQLYYHRKWVLHYMGSKAKITQQQVQAWASTWLAVFNEASKDNLLKSTPVLHCPIYFFVGRKDYQTNSTLTEKYFQSLTAPKKELFWFERSAHSLPTTEPALMQRIIIEKILPATR
ncbi:alpha/beta hydrolase [Chryseolinea sp. H1M3-3]|uniref:alpha/beta fold hydrolase n=1 Tax=Chryseolinea sp. H1M3-3 TaxID=3034144 RepID=UPI0023EAB3FC|nr:alpha/beta hydrolase [Chryseolinea sp. H1M3-3]